MIPHAAGSVGPVRVDAPRYDIVVWTPSGVSVVKRNLLPAEATSWLAERRNRLTWPGAYPRPIQERIRP